MIFNKIHISIILLLAVPAGLARAEAAAAAVGLEDCERWAVAEHPSLRLAAEETRVAALKRAEAYRGIWPLLSVKGEITNGLAVRELGSPDFVEESYGLQMSQPLLQGGRLFRTYRQARFHWLSVQAKEEKTRQEVLYGVREAYWSFVKARRAEAAFEAAAGDLAAERAAAEGLARRDVISRQVYLSIVSQAEQARLNLEAARAESTARLWQWTAALGRNAPPDFRPALDLPADTEPVPGLERCLAWARSVHPELAVQRYAAEAARYGGLAGRALYWPRLAVNGFYGRSGGAYENENFELREDWQAGVQLTQYFGGNTLNAAAQEIKTSPKLGQSTRTQSRNYTASVGLMDGLKQRSETAEAVFAAREAAEQARRTALDVANGVRAAYADFAKARAQRRIAETERDLARMENTVARVKSTNREIPLSDRAVARNKWAQAEAGWAEALAEYRIAAAALSRAVGEPQLFKKDTP